MTLHHNECNKSRGKGSIFQGSYKGKTINDDEYLRYVAGYIMVKNTFELYSGGLIEATKNFEDAWTWAQNYDFSSFADYFGVRNSVIIDKELLGEIMLEQDLKEFFRDIILGGKWYKDKEIQRLSFE